MNLIILHLFKKKIKYEFYLLIKLNDKIVFEIKFIEKTLDEHSLVRNSIKI